MIVATELFPIEIWEHIFTYTCMNDDLEDSVGTCVSPYHIMAVCRAWKDLETNLPRLWTRVHLKGSSHPYLLDDVPAMARKLNLYCQRAQRYLLCVVADDSSSISSISDRAAERISALKLQADAVPLKLGPISFPRLHTLSIHSGNASQIARLSRAMSCPSLKTLHWSSRAHWDNFALPWHQLTSLTITCWENALYGLIAECTSLTDLNATLIPQEHQDYVAPMLESHTLRTLSIRPTIPQSILRYTSFPSVSTLKAEVGQSTTVVDFVGFVQRSRNISKLLLCGQSAIDVLATLSPALAELQYQPIIGNSACPNTSVFVKQ